MEPGRPRLLSEEEIREIISRGEKQGIIAGTAIKDPTSLNEVPAPDYYIATTDFGEEVSVQEMLAGVPLRVLDVTFEATKSTVLRFGRWLKSLSSEPYQFFH